MLAPTDNRPPWDVTALDRAFRLYRRHPRRFGRDVASAIGVLVLYRLAMGSQSGSIDWARLSPLSAGEVSALPQLLRLGMPLGEALAIQLQPIVFCLLAAYLLTTMVTQTAAGLALDGEKPGGPAAYRGLSVALLPLTLLLLPILAIEGVLAELLREGVWLAVVNAELDLGITSWLAELWAWGLSWLAPLGLLVVLLDRLLLALPITMLEPGGPIAALRRSWRLTRGAHLRAALTVLLLAGLTALLSSLPALLYTTATGAEAGDASGTPIGALTGLAIEALLFPLLPIALTLLYLERRDEVEGLDLERRVAALTRADADALRERADARVKAGDFMGALPELDQLLRLDPADAKGLALRQTARSRSGDPAGALADAEAALRRSPNHPHLLGCRAIARAEAGDETGAAEDIARALALRPSFPQELQERATAYYHAGRLLESLGLLDLLHRFTPEDGWPLYNAACVMARLGRADGALARLEGAIARDPSWAAQAQSDHNFTILRDDPRFQALQPRGAPVG